MKHCLHIGIFALTAALLLFPLLALANGTPPWQAADLKNWLAVNAPRQIPSSAEAAEPSLSIVARFYGMVNYRNVWIDANGLRPVGEDLLNAFR